MSILAITILAALGVLLWAWRRPLDRARVDWRGVLARLPLPMLALAASYGVYSFARLFVPEWVAIVQAAAFELTYIGLAVARHLDIRQSARARLISVGAVAASIIYNTLAGWFERQPDLLVGAQPVAWLALALLHGAPLAWVAFLVADLLLHSQPTRRPAHRARLARLLWRLRGDARQVRDVRAAEQSGRAMLETARAQLETIRADRAEQARELEATRAENARLSADLAHISAEGARQDAEAARAVERAAQLERDLAQAETSAAQHGDRAARLEIESAQHQAKLAQAAQQLREYEQVLAQVRADLDVARAASSVDVLAVARRLVALGEPIRQAAPLLGIPEGTLRGRLKAQSNGHAVVSSSDD